MAYGYYAGGGGEIPFALLIFIVVFGMFAISPISAIVILWGLGTLIFLFTQPQLFESPKVEKKESPKVEDKKQKKSVSERFREGYRWCSRCIYKPTTRLVIDKSIKNCPDCGCFLRYSKSWSQTDKSDLDFHDTFRLKDEEDRYYDDLCDGVYDDV